MSELENTVTTKSTIVSLSMKPELHKQLKDAAIKGNFRSVSEVVRRLTVNYLPLLINDENEFAVPVSIPVALKGNEKELREWLANQGPALFDSICKASAAG